MTSLLSDSHGWYLINKPRGLSSSHITYNMKKRHPRQRVGHAGTLDPMASGLLPIMVGGATKFIENIMNNAKTYHTLALWGMETSTDDIQGVIQNISHRKAWCRHKLEDFLQSWVGSLWQYPPLYSARRYKGKRLYSYARKGQHPPTYAKKITLFDIQLLDHHERWSVFSVTSSSGFYVRRFIKDLGRIMQCFGCASSIYRTSIGSLNTAHAVSWEDFCTNKPPMLCLSSLAHHCGLYETSCSDQQKERLIHGCSTPTDLPSGQYLCRWNLRPIALSQVHHGIMHPKHVWL